MAEKSGELKNPDNLDPVTTAAGVPGDQSLEKFSDDLSPAERYELESNTGDAPEETEQIRARIEETRSQMGETIDAIQERLSFSNISEQVSETVSNAIETAKDTAYDATIGKAVNFMKNVGDGVSHSGAFRVAKKNPFPLALIGLGAGLLAYQAMNSKGRRGDGRRYDRSSFSPERSTLASAKSSVAGASGRLYDGISERAGSAYDSVSNAAGSAYESVSNAAGSAYGSVSDAMSNAYAGANDIAHRAYDRAGEYGTMAHEKYDEYLEENPLALGALAVAVGAAVGFAIPSTRYEGKLMGEARDNVLNRAQEAAGSFIDRAKQVTAEAGKTIRDETSRSLGH